MFIQPTPDQLREWQINQYEQLLKTATSKGAIEFLTDALANFLKPISC